MTYTTRTEIKTTDSELAVITRAKDICSYIFVITQKSPKHFRFSLVTRLHNIALDIIEDLYLANENYPVGEHRAEIALKRRYWQDEARTKLRLLAYISYLSSEQGCILQKQYETMAKMIIACEKLLAGWKKSTMTTK